MNLQRSLTYWQEGFTAAGVAGGGVDGRYGAILTDTRPE
jgi:hypothetical protein